MLKTGRRRDSRRRLPRTCSPSAPRLHRADEASSRCQPREADRLSDASGKGLRRSNLCAGAPYRSRWLALAHPVSSAKTLRPHCFSRTHWAMGHAPALMVMHRQRRRVGNDNGEHHSAILVHEDVAVHDISPAVIDETASHLEVTWDGFLGCRLIWPC